MSSKTEKQHITNDKYVYSEYKRTRANEIRQKEKKKLANRRKNKRN